MIESREQADGKATPGNGAQGERHMLGTRNAYAPALETFAGRFDTDALMDTARRTTGLDDWGGCRWHEETFRLNLKALCAGIEEEAELSGRGRDRAHSRLHVMLCSRLLYLEARKASDCDAERIAAPLIGTGMPRAGTTFLHGLLAQDEDNMLAATVEAAMPAVPDAGLYQSVLAFQGLLDPDLTDIHPAGATMPEECIFLQEGVCHSLYGVYFDSPSYSSAVAGQAAIAYDWQRGLMQFLQARKGGRRWALKGPGHMHSWAEMLIAFPDASIYVNHRDPAKVIPSIASLFQALRRRFSERGSDPHRVGAQQLAGWAQAMNAQVDWRLAGEPPIAVADVHYKDLIVDPVATVAVLYDRFDIPFTKALEERILRHLDADRHGKGAKHRYSLADFGLDPDAIEAAFGRYIDFFDIERERGA